MAASSKRSRAPRRGARRAFAAALILLLPASGLAETFSRDLRTLGRRKVNCFESECVLNPLGAHRYFRQDGIYGRLGPDPSAVGQRGVNELFGRSASPSPSEGVRKPVGPGRPFGLESPASSYGGGLFIPGR